MPITIKLPTPLRRHTNQQKTFEAASANVADALRELIAAHPGVEASLYADCGGLKPFVRVFVSGVDIADIDGETTALKDGDVLSIVPPVAGA